jgi:hypothetical protein
MTERGRPWNSLPCCSSGNRTTFSGWPPFFSRGTSRCDPHSSSPAAVAWFLYAVWEWLVIVRTPEANIRVDLLVIWPVLAMLSAWLLFRALRK